MLMLIYEKKLQRKLPTWRSLKFVPIGEQNAFTSETKFPTV